MSRIGNAPITIPSGVEIKVSPENLVSVKGPLGSLEEQLDKELTVKIDGDTLTVSRPNDSKRLRALHGLSRTLIFNMVEGTTKGYEKKLIIEGTGYKAQKSGKTLTLNLGHSHNIVMEDPEGITTEAPTATSVVVKGINKQQVGNYAANIRDWRKPEPYKGKGVRYEDEHIVRKEGKTGKKK